MAVAYGFDGWFINIEKTFPIARWDVEHLLGFLNQLRSALGVGHVVWYDALTVHNMILYQNGLTDQNSPFARAAGAILTNYDWTPQAVAAAKTKATENAVDPRNVIFGIDVWAQNVSEHKPPRKSWPTEGGGGTGTGRGVAQIATSGLSAGIFAPAWPYEHFPSHSEVVEQTMWTGCKLPGKLHCDCQPLRPHEIGFYKDYPIARSVDAAPVGTETFFYTDFRQAYERKGCSLVAEIGHQSVLPTLIFCEHRKAIVTLLQQQPSRLEILLNRQVEDLDDSGRESKVFTLQLFSLSMAEPASLCARIRYSKPTTPEGVVLVFRFDGTSSHYVLPESPQSSALATVVLDAPTHARMSGISLEVQQEGYHGYQPTPLRLCEVLDICVQKTSAQRPQCTIKAAQLYVHGSSPFTSNRLRWSLTTTSDEVNNGSPRSMLTGPYSHFDVDIVGLQRLRTYALECLIEEDVATKLREDDGISIHITGVGFDGQIIGKRTFQSDSVTKMDEDWLAVHGEGSQISLVTANGQL